jgi:hypothetical protein
MHLILRTFSGSYIPNPTRLKREGKGVVRVGEEREWKKWKEGQTKLAPSKI